MINIAVYNGTVRAEAFSVREVEGLNYGTMYPGGLYSTCSFFLPELITRLRNIKGVYRVVVRDGQKIAWNGLVDDFQYASSGGREGHVVTATGDWGAFLNRRSWNKPWADTRLDAQTWYEPTTAYAGTDITLKQNMSVDRLNRIRFTPKAVAWANGDFHATRYSAPVGETVKRVTCSYDMQEAAQAWRLGLFNEASATTDWSVTASGASTMDTTFGTPSRYIFFYFQALAAQTPASDGTIYGEVSSVVVYTETGSINLTEIAKDVRAHDSSIDSSEIWIGSNTLSLVPFITNGEETYASILTRAASYGDSSANPWACYLGDSETLAGDTFPLPLLVVEQQPALTSADYVIQVKNIADLQASVDYSNIWNHIKVNYRDATGKSTWITPDDDATLKDTTSQANYGARHYTLSINTQSATTATDYGQRFLAAYKDPKILIPSPIVVSSVTGLYGEEIPASLVRAGKRLKISNFLNDITGTGLTLLITGTAYDADSNTVSITTGQPDPLAVISSRLAVGMKW